MESRQSTIHDFRKMIRDDYEVFKKDVKKQKYEQQERERQRLARERELRENS